MSKNETMRTSAVMLWMIVLCGGLLMPAGGVLGQETAEPAAAAATDAAATAAEDEQEAAGETARPQAAEEGSVAPGGSVTGQDIEFEEETPEDVAEAGIGAMWIGLIVLALFVVPMILGTLVARALRMPEYGWKISLVLGSLSASLVIITFGDFKFGPDLAGGITLVYEIEEGDQVGVDDAVADTGVGRSDIEDTLETIKRRIDPTGTRELTVRQFGPNAVEIIIPETGQDQLEYVKQQITALGQLEFRITADPTQPKDRRIIELAKTMPPTQKNVMIGGEKVAEWVAYNVEEFGPVEQDSGIVKRLAGKRPEALVLMDPWNVIGDHLIPRQTVAGFDETGQPAVHFVFNTEGATRFKRLTSENRPNPATGAMRNLGIVLDRRLISAPVIRETISRQGQISGQTMGEEEVNYIVSILKEGSLPLQLNKDPISEEIISPTLGAVTIEKGKMAITVSLAAVLLFMLIYYRFAGIVACIVLTLNLLLVVAIMGLIDAAFTLPGLAGLVLTIGMSVDANILIYERIREELTHGAALRMAIRNGFGRAMSAIIDSNVTTIISGIALYVFATDQVKGFAVTLILGILTSMYTAIFCARLIFDVAERQGWVRKLSMLRLLAAPNFDFLRMRWIAGAISLAVIAVGLVAVYQRGAGLLDIDFSGGSSVTFLLEEEHKMPISEVRATLLDTPLAERNLVVVERGETQTRYSLDTSEQSVEDVKQTVEEAFAGKLLTYTVDAREVEPFEEGSFTGVEAKVTVNAGPMYEGEEGISHDALVAEVRNALLEAELEDVEVSAATRGYEPGSVARFTDWTVRLGGIEPAAAENVLSQLQNEMNTTAMFPLASEIGGRVSSSMQLSALLAMFVSLLGVVLYLWIRFQKVTYGLAAAAALVHDVLITVGMLALSASVVNWLPAVATALQIDSFQISLTIVAALLTIIGYSLNDTIVTFDRLREVKGKSPDLTAGMVNTSVNQTLSRTLLTALTVFLVVVILYFFGGDGIHGFAFAFLIGTIAGTYSTIYIAAPVLLWLSGSSAESSGAAPAMSRAG